jgi:hypothetical protein
MEAASEPTPAEEKKTNAVFLPGYEGEARVLCAVTSRAAASAATACSGYMVEWLWLSSPPPPDAAAATSAPAAGEDGMARGKGPADASADARADDGLDFVPEADMHGGRFVPA